MVRFGQLPGDPGAAPAQPGWAGIRTLTLRDYFFDRSRQGPLLVDRHLLILVTVGHGTQDIDFRTYPCRPGSLLWVRPGQVVQHGGQGGLDAVLVCWTPQTMRDLDVSPIGPPFAAGFWQLAGEDEDAVINEVSQLVVDCQRHRGGALATDLLRHQLAVLLLRLALLPRDPADPAAVPAPPHTRNGGAPDGTDPTGTFWRLRHEVERSYGQTRRVEDYAGRLDCSVRTLTRACLAATGRSAKQVIDERVALEARRLLAATDLSVAEVGRRLGFPEPTNFGRFFQREVGRSPGAFRAGLPGRSPAVQG
ncbi:AraC family transcriptional regulator [Plantactinospora sp. KLBMP9567]|uniref:AraC family transcriptional regulator n=1 Tax=Plantactinospora sp. KLBMP9567 TaxID=3085900 RepID=UPI002980C130|nr:AraC family transcriptional regulator [Plantactinospora sp. KLBMP9567]MDW5330104.1 AraC family transcriptional regulator [Plantactinospora sp. KLBMP9567]